VLVVPVKSFRTAKSRLDGALPEPDRRRLARRLADGVLEAGRGWHRVVVTRDDEVARWAADAGAEVLRTDRQGLVDEVQRAHEVCLERGTPRVTVVPGDLARPARLAEVLDDALVDAPGTAVIVPDRRGDGTNVLSLPSAPGFRFRYGPGSAEAHPAEAVRRGLRGVVVADADLGWDVDVPDDLVGLGPDPGATL
jgi:2-phospho-L-lactate guanylyltransferase